MPRLTKTRKKPAKKLTWQERVQSEKLALDLKIEKLNAFLVKPGTGISEKALNLLRAQKNYMVRYSEVLGERLAEG